jgi:hypothetical protein
MRLRPAIALTLASLLSLAAACESASTAVDHPPAAAAGKDCETAGGGGASLTASPDPAFNQDILPILSSSGGDRDYKCTNCHPLYNHYADVANPVEFAKILRSIKTRRMPLGPGRVTAADYALLKRWQATGFRVDRPVTKPQAEAERDAGEAGGISGTSMSADAQPCR